MSNLELKGLRNLLGLDDLLAESKTADFARDDVFHLPIGMLVSGKYQPRTVMDTESIQELAISIKSQGIILPLLVRRLNKEKFEIIAGERRWKAAAIAGLKTVPAIIKDIPDQTACAFALIENIQRESLNAIDEAVAFDRLITEFFLTHEEIAERIGRSRSTVTNLIRLLALDEEVKDLLRNRKLEMGHARALLSLDQVGQKEIAQKIITKMLSVRQTEKLVHNMKSPRIPVPIENQFEEKITQWQEVLSEKLSSTVKVKLNVKGEGAVIISIQSPDEVSRLIAKIK